MDLSAADRDRDKLSIGIKRSEFVELIQLCPARPYVELIVPGDIKSVERLTIITVSHDQGFSGSDETWHGTYTNSNTWFEIVAISSSNHERAPARIVQRNLHASREPKRHENVYDIHDSDEEVRGWLSTIHGGDTIQLIMRAEFPSWTNFCYEAELKMVGQLAPINHAVLQYDTLATKDCSSSYYQPLSQSNREIRVLQVHPGSFDEPITCTLQTMSVDNTSAPNYDALSYCWGDLHFSNTIQLHVQSTRTSLTEQHEISVPSSVFNALRYLRPEDGSAKLLWIDFICINQADLEERAAQVAIMLKIYSRAERVRIWLGTHTTVSEEVFQAIRMVASRYESRDDAPITSHDQGEVQSHHGLPIQDCINFIKIWRRCDFSWFKRTWVLQEVANARSAIVHCGRDTLPWPVILRLSECIMTLKQQTSLFRYGIMPSIFSSIFLLGSDGSIATNQEMRKDGILNVLVRGHDLDATDPRDKIFALLQFGSETWDSERLPDLIKPNYTKSEVQTFADFTRWWIATHKSLRILSAVHTTKDRGWERMSSKPPVDVGDLGRPTWCFWHGGVSSWAKATLALSEDATYRATSDSVPDMEIIDRDMKVGKPTTLSLRGYQLCTVSSVEPYRIFNEEAVEEINTVFFRLFDPIGDHKTWIWNREEQAVRVDRYRSGDKMFWEHLSGHFEHVHKTGGALPCYSPCYLQGDAKNAQSGGIDIGLCPHNARIGDVVVLLEGGCVPYILRKNPHGILSDQIELDKLNSEDKYGYEDSYHFVGECYLQGHMDGSSYRKMLAESVESTIFHLA